MKRIAILVLIFSFISCTAKKEDLDPNTLTIKFWEMLFFKPQECNSFMRDRMAVQSNKRYFKASKEQVEDFCKDTQSYIRLYTKPIKIDAEVDTEYKPDEFYLMNALLHSPKNVHKVRTAVIKLDGRWYILP